MSHDAKVEYPSYDNSYIQIQFDEKGIVSDIITTNESIFPAEKYYKLSDLDSIIINKSTPHDVFEIGPSFGGIVNDERLFIKYPLEDGTFLKISFDFEMTVVIDKEVCDEP